MMTDAEKAAYARGYHAGQKRKRRDISREKVLRERQQFLDRLFLALLPAAMTVQGWRIEGELITTAEQRIRMARIWAREALTERHLNLKP